MHIDLFSLWILRGMKIVDPRLTAQRCLSHCLRIETSHFPKGIRCNSGPMTHTWLEISNVDLDPSKCVQLSVPSISDICWRCLEMRWGCQQVIRRLMILIRSWVDEDASRLPLSLPVWEFYIQSWVLIESSSVSFGPQHGWEIAISPRKTVDFWHIVKVVV